MTEVNWGEAFRLRRHFKLASNSGAFCDLSMEAGFLGEGAVASILRVTPHISDHYGRREGQVVEVTLDDDGKGSAELALPVGGEAIGFTANFEIREDLGNRVTVNLSGKGVEPYTDEFFVNGFRPAAEAKPATSSLAERARLPEGAILDEGYPFGTQEGYIAGGQVYANLGQFGRHEEHAPTGHEKPLVDHGLGAC